MSILKRRFLHLRELRSGAMALSIGLYDDFFIRKRHKVVFYGSQCDLYHINYVIHSKSYIGCAYP